jgi:hypothetical protein
MRNTAIALLLGFTLLLSGCAALGPVFQVEVSGLAAPATESRKSFILIPGLKDVAISDLQFQEYAGHVSRALMSQGFSIAANAETADLVVVLFYGIGDPTSNVRSFSLPVWGQTGVASSHTTGTVNVWGNTGSYSGTTTYTPSYGVTGYKTHVQSYTTYFRFAQLSAYDFKTYKSTGKEIQLWETTITSTGSSGDLRQVFPILVAAGAPFFGRSTDKNVTVNLLEQDPRVLSVKGISNEKQKTRDR